MLAEQKGKQQTYRSLQTDSQRIISLKLLNPDTNNDGKVDRSEKQVYNMLMACDADGDGFLSIRELYTALTKVSSVERSRYKTKRALIFASVIIIAQALLNAMLVCLAVWGFKDSFVTSAGGYAMTDRDGTNIVSVAQATHTLPMYVAPILPEDELYAVQKVAFTYYDERENTTVSQGAQIVSAIRHSNTSAELIISFGTPRRALVVKEGLANLVEGSKVRRICAADAQCSSFTVQSADAADELIARADEALEARHNTCTSDASACRHMPPTSFRAPVTELTPAGPAYRRKESSWRRTRRTSSRAAAAASAGRIKTRTRARRHHRCRPCPRAACGLWTSAPAVTTRRRQAPCARPGSPAAHVCRPTEQPTRRCAAATPRAGASRPCAPARPPTTRGSK